jgi:(S)-ureidoglycine aminohydrolase
MTNAVAIVHVSPARGAAFTQYTVEFERGGKLGPAIGQRFLYVLRGSVTCGDEILSTDQFAYIPESVDVLVESPDGGNVALIEKTYQPLINTDTPQMFTGAERIVQPSPLLGDSSIQVRPLLPDDGSFDFAVNTMTYDPGSSLPMVEIHVMEHGLLMLDGGGIYRLGDCWYPVTAGDFIWMAPYCPQWFGALGKTSARYLIYKDFNRHPLAEA